MKKLMLVAMLAGSMVAMAQDAEAPAASDPAPTAVKARAKRAKLTPEERKAKFEKTKNARKAATEAKLLDVVRKYVPEEEKAKELVRELMGVMTPARRARAAKTPAPAPAE